MQLEKDGFQELVTSLGFSEEQEVLLSKLYTVKKQELSDALTKFELKLPKYHDMQWRFEVQVIILQRITSYHTSKKKQLP